MTRTGRIFFSVAMTVELMLVGSLLCLNGCSTLRHVLNQQTQEQGPPLWGEWLGLAEKRHNAETQSGLDMSVMRSSLCIAAFSVVIWFARLIAFFKCGNGLDVGPVLATNAIYDMMLAFLWAYQTHCSTTADEQLKSFHTVDGAASWLSIIATLWFCFRFLFTFFFIALGLGEVGDARSGAMSEIRRAPDRTSGKDFKIMAV